MPKSNNFNYYDTCRTTCKSVCRTNHQGDRDYHELVLYDIIDRPETQYFLDLNLVALHKVFKKMTECFCILVSRLKTVVIIIITKKHTIRCLFCLSLSLFSLRRLLYASYKNKKSSVATNFYLHCNITFCVFQKGVRKAEGRREEGKERGE